MRSHIFFASLLPTALAAPTQSLLKRNEAPAGAVVVDQTLTVAGSFATVQEAVDSLANRTTAQTLFIYPGRYVEQVLIPDLQGPLIIQGSTNDSSTYQYNTATIAFNNTRLYTTSNDLAATLRVHTSNVKIYNINIANTFSPHIESGGQNLALSAANSGQGYYGVQFLGYQDTIQANEGYQVYAKCLIVGAIDFIYGQNGSVLVDNSDIRINGKGYITAPGRATEDIDSWYVISNSNIEAINDTIPASSTFLGRPWRPWARSVFQNSYLGTVVNATGWVQWNKATPNIVNATFAEFNNTGPSSVAVVGEGVRANFSQQLDAAVPVARILGEGWADEFWADTSYMATLV